jgi:thioredoxin-like negative regulator of GroEL
MALCHVALGADGETYADAHRAMMKSGKPMVVMVTADWCPHCQVMKQDVIPQIRRRGLFKRVAFAIVDSDREQQLAQQLTGGGLIPQLVMYRQTPKGWVRYVLKGGQSVESVENFISQGLASDAADNAQKKSADDAADSADKPETKVEETKTKS